jgi:hypothetical protein
VDRYDRRYIAAARANRDATGLPGLPRGVSRSVKHRRDAPASNVTIHGASPWHFSAFAVRPL